MTNFLTYLARIKRKLLQKPYLEDKRFPAYWFDQLLGDELAFIVQIGSNDGKTGDPLYPLFQKHQRWKGLLVEPVPYAFERLSVNYPDRNRFKLENVAVNQGQVLDFYWVDPAAADAIPDLPYWYDQLGSFDKAHILKELNGVLAPFIRTTHLEGITLKTLLERNEIENIDILHLDTEGYDWKILSQLDLDNYLPAFILFEYHHLPIEEMQAVQHFLAENYQLFKVGIDILAVNKVVGEKTIEAMRRRMTMINA
jgi:FkbM family methyltransferase